MFEGFGQSFFNLCMNSHGSMLTYMGGSLKDFFNTMDSVHEHLLVFFPGMRPPSFRAVEGKTRGVMELYYSSERVGFERLVVGMVKTVARELYNTEVLVEVGARTTAVSWVKFTVTLKNDTVNRDVLCGTNENMAEPEEALKAVPLSTKISPETFCKACPFHVIFDRDMVIHQSGTSMLRVIPSMEVGKSKFFDVFECLRPHVKLDFHTILPYANKIFIVRTKDGVLDSNSMATAERDESHSMRLRGQMLHLPECDSIMFLCTPSVVSLDGLNEKGAPRTLPFRPPPAWLMLVLASSRFTRGLCLCLRRTCKPAFRNAFLFARMRVLLRSAAPSCCPESSRLRARRSPPAGLYLSDIPIYDATRDLILQCEQRKAESLLSQRLEVLTDRLQQASRELEKEQQMTDQLLYSILPTQVANDLRLGRPVSAKKYDLVTIMFSGIVDFPGYCDQNREPMEIVELLNDVYTKLDALTESYKEVYKVGVELV